MGEGAESGGEATVEGPFRLVEATAPGRFVFASPHSGDLYPADMKAAPRLSEASLRSAEDALVDRLIAPGTDGGAGLLLGRIGRAYVDLNRDPEDLDPALIEGLEGRTPSPRAAAGYGVLPRLTGDGRPLYDRRLDLGEARARLAAVHAPYHAALGRLMQEAKSRFGEAVLVDWHSMPSRAAGGARGPDVVLGDRHGSSCAAALTRRLRRSFESIGWRVALNQPYSGGWTTQTWGRPEAGFHAVQVELNRALYLDEATGRTGPGWSRCAAGVARAIAELLADQSAYGGA